MLMGSNDLWWDVIVALSFAYGLRAFMLNDLFSEMTVSSTGVVLLFLLFHLWYAGSPCICWFVSSFCSNCLNLLG